jgi:transposase-like protein
MANNRNAPEQVINKMRQAEEAISSGRTVSETSRQIGGAEQTYYKWRNEYGGLRIDQVKRLNRAVADLTLDNQILKEAAEGNF